VLGHVVQLPRRLPVLRQDPLQRPQEQLIVLRAVVRLLHTPVAVAPLLRSGEMVANVVAFLLQKAEDAFIGAGVQQRLPAGRVGALVMHIGGRLFCVALDGFVRPPAQIIQESPARVRQVVRRFDASTVHRYESSSILKV